LHSRATKVASTKKRGSRTPRKGVERIAVDGTSQYLTTAIALLRELVRTDDDDFINGLITGPDYSFKEGAIKFMLSVVKGIKPRDQLEAKPTNLQNEPNSKADGQ
jgi:hypothetical protein